MKILQNRAKMGKIETALEVLQGMRKFVVMVLLIAIGIIFRVENLINGDNFVTLLEGTAVAFMASNSIEHLSSAVKAWVGVGDKDATKDSQ